MAGSNVSVNVCSKCRRTHLHIQAVESGYRKCPECIHIEITGIRPDSR